MATVLTYDFSVRCFSYEDVLSLPLKELIELQKTTIVTLVGLSALKGVLVHIPHFGVKILKDL